MENYYEVWTYGSTNFFFYTVKEMTERKIETSFFKRYCVNSKTIVPCVNNVKINRVLK
jgi:hypothetical protein